LGTFFELVFRPVKGGHFRRTRTLPHIVHGTGGKE
jgi:hypothetical protein